MITGSLERKVVEFAPITVKFVLNTKEDLDKFVKEFGRTSFCHDVYCALAEIQEGRK